MKKVFPVILCLAMLLSMSITAGAETEQVVATISSTSYEITDNTVYASVNVSVSGVDNGEQTTFIAYDTKKPNPETTNDPNKDNIIYIDQMAHGDSPYFSFKRKIEDINPNVIIKSGAETKDVSEPIKIAEYNAIAGVTSEGGTVTVGTFDDEEFKPFPEGTNPLNESKVWYEIKPDDGYTFKSIKVDNEELVSRLMPNQEEIIYYEILEFTKDTSVVAEFQLKLEQNRLASPVSYTEADANEEVTIASRFNVTSGATDFSYGILFSKDKSELQAITKENFLTVKKITESDWDEADVINFPGLYHGADGRFAVQLVDDREESMNILGGPYYIKSYIEVGEDIIISSELLSFNIGE